MYKNAHNIKIQYYSIYLVLLQLLLPYASSHIFPAPSSIPDSHNKSRSPWSSFHAFAGCEIGKRYPGLFKLKNYFYNFGYIPNHISAINFTDDFDDTIQAAIKQYQRNFNLNVTGELDTQTLQYMSRPRCGNPDIINGTNSMLNTSKPKPSSTNSSRTHTVSHYSFFSGVPRWPSYHYDLTYAFLPSNQLSPTAKSVFSRAFSRWAAVTPLTFTETKSYYSADITIGFYGGDHGDGEPFDGSMGTLAHSFAPTIGMLHLDIDEMWVFDEDVTKSLAPEAIDLESVVVHEIGHLLGMGHSADENSTMYPMISTRTKKVELGRDDVDGIQVLYGNNPDYNASENTNDEVSNDVGRLGRTGGSWWWGWEVCTLMMGVLVFL